MLVTFQNLKFWGVTVVLLLLMGVGFRELDKLFAIVVHP
jgi:hypothetical protein